MADQGLISERLVGLWLGRDGAGGELTLGGVNEARYSGDQAWASILLNPDGWVVPAENITVGEASLCSDYCHVVMSTNTPHFYMSEESAKAFNDVLGGVDVPQLLGGGGVDLGLPGVALLNCDTLNTMPNLKLEFAGRTLELTPLEYTFTVSPFQWLKLCISGFIGVPTLENNVMQMGTLFGQQFFTVYDMDNMRVGFANSAIFSDSNHGVEEAETLVSKGQTK